MSSRLTLITTLQRQSELETLLSQAFIRLLEKPSYALMYSERYIIETIIHHQKRAASYAADARYEMGMGE